MRQGDFSQLAKAYVHRPAYAVPVIDALAGQTGHQVADIGAGTGKLTKMLAERGGLSGFAVEPTDEMRHEGEQLGLPGFTWVKGTAEATGLDDNAFDWVTMASAFHWTDAPKALAEFHRILRPGGLLTLMWNPRDVEHDPLQSAIEAKILEIYPQLQRKSSGAAAYTQGLEDILMSSGLWGDLLFLEAPHIETMSVERHMGAWRSVNDVPAQAGPEKWAEILAAIEDLLKGRDQIDVRYRTRAWSVRKV
ncbi:class I SAM-dependent methyltransferase (plasmid) [Brevundimonas staleyi]|uniref:Class I SAM-dependent methyltransferase n=1 Tax=Brevundimonas staleyi TaxID=74326 RepID=A0ABW0FPS5_9CAUL